MSHKNRIGKLENRSGGFKNRKERLKCFRFAKKLKPELTLDDMRTKAEYKKLLKDRIPNFFSGEPEPEKEAAFNELFS